jgi:F-type H+-transporting ATPase subunit alpha
MKLDLAQYDDLKAFAAFASDLDAASRAQLERGARLVELLKQGQGAPVPVAKQVVSIWAGTTGRLDDVPVEDIRRFEAEFLDYISREHGDLLDSITTTGELSDENTATLEQAVDSFKQQFVTASGQPLVKDEPVEAMGEGEEDLTKIRRRTRTEADVRKVAAPDAGSGEPAA